jgi:hypothetical protein
MVRDERAVEKERERDRPDHERVVPLWHDPPERDERRDDRDHREQDEEQGIDPVVVDEPGAEDRHERQEGEEKDGPSEGLAGLDVLGLVEVAVHDVREHGSDEDEDREGDQERPLRDRPEEVEHRVDRVDREPEEEHGRDREPHREEEGLDRPDLVHAEDAEEDDPGDPGQVDEADHLSEERDARPVLLEHEREPEQELDAEDDPEERDDPPVVEPERVTEPHSARSTISRYAAIVRSEIGPQESSRVIFS